MQKKVNMKKIETIKVREKEVAKENGTRKEE